MNKSRNFNSIIVIAMILLAFVVVIQYSSNLFSSSSDVYNVSTLQSDMEQGSINNVVIMPNAETPTGAVKVSFNNGKNDVVFYSTDVTVVESLVNDKGIRLEVKDIPSENVLINGIIPIIVGLVVLVFMYSMMMGIQAGGGGNSKMLNFGKSRAKMSTGEENNIKLDDVAGLKEEKEQLAEIIEFLKDPGKFTKVGARIPKGVLLEGAPGTGKTLLAKAVAGEAGVPFFRVEFYSNVRNGKKVWIIIKIKEIIIHLVMDQIHPEGRI